MTQVTSLFRKLGERFTDNSGDALAGGKIYYYEAGTTTLQNTYSDADGTSANTNPLVLDAYGRLQTAVYLTTAADFKELLTDSSDNTIDPWPMDDIPAAVDPLAGQTGFSLPLVPWLIYTSASSPVTITTAYSGYGFEANTSGGSVEFDLPSAASVGAGKVLWIKKTSSSNTVSIVPNGTDNIDGANDTYTLSAANQCIGIASDGADWQIISAVIASPEKPKGRLTLTTGTPVIAADVTNTATIYYTAFEGNTIPIWNGAAFIPVSFSSDLSLTLTSAAGANSIVDVFAINSSGTPILGFGPAWGTVTPGSCARGSGAGTTELELVSGIWTNANEITLTNGVTTYASIAANKATYLGSISIDGTAGKTSCYVAAGQARKWGVWNAYNRQLIVLQAYDSTASWTYGTATWRQSNGSSSNYASVFTGLAEENVCAEFCQGVTANNSGIYYAYIGIGVNSTTSPTGKSGFGRYQQGAANTASDLVAKCIVAPDLGLNTLNCLENTSGNWETFNGDSYMRMIVQYLG
jgi:hypothetical protein